MVFNKINSHLILVFLVPSTFTFYKPLLVCPLANMRIKKEKEEEEAHTDNLPISLLLYIVIEHMMCVTQISLLQKLSRCITASFFVFFFLPLIIYVVLCRKEGL